MIRKPKLNLKVSTYCGERDIGAIAGLFNAASFVDGPEYGRTEEEIRQMIDSPRTMPRENLYLFAVAGQVVAYGRTYLEEGLGESVFRLSGLVHPDWRRKGIGRRVFERLEQRIYERLDEAENQTVSILVVANLEHKGRQALFRKMGYQMVRYFFDMECPLREGEVPAGAPAALPAAVYPPGIVVQNMIQRPDLKAVWKTCDEAFRDHWGHTESTWEDWQHWVGEPKHRPDLWLLAWDAETDEPAGVCLNGIDPDHNSRVGREEGWVHVLAVRQPYRRQGLGRALLLEGMCILQQAGADWAMLGVDMENLTGALRLYEGVGFRAIKRYAAFRKQVRS